MSVIVELSIFPMDKGSSLSPYVSRAVRIVKESGLPYQLGPMGTCMEGEWPEVMAVVNKCVEELRKDSSRIYINMKADYQAGKDGRLEGKVRSVEEKL
ncbi:MAG: MTH1187 family thiamine-binding protein [Smithellaceae bacterium]|nr:MTH1187 family thiamine-binding protein [Smithellaceae bacterium]